MDGSKLIDIEQVVGAIGDFTDDAIIITEAEPVSQPGPRILWANKAFFQMTGYAPEEILGQTPRMLQGKDTDPKALEKIRAALKVWKPVRVELKNYRKDGTPFWVELGIQPVTDEKGWHHYWIAIQRETTERNERDQLLKKTTQVIDGAPIALGLLAPDNHLTFANSHFKQLLFGDKKPPALPFPYGSWLRAALDTNSDAAAGADWVNRHMSDLFSSPRRSEHRLQGCWHEFRRISTSLGDQLIIGEDIEDRIKLQDQIRHMAKMDAMGKMTSGVAHDFNNILAVILGNTELLQDRVTDGSDQDEFIDETIRAVLRGRSLTQSLLSFARKSRIEAKPNNVIRLARETIEMFQRTAASGAHVSFDAPQELPQVSLDAGLFQNALLNLLINARDAMPDTGEILVSANVVQTNNVSNDDGPNSVRIVVQDHGTGMAPHILEQAVDPFFTTKDVGKGSGLGLSMVMGFVEQSGGVFNVDSRPGQGTTVTMEFRSEPTNPVAPGTRQEKPHDLRGLNVILVEDEAGYRQSLQRMLEAAGAKVVAVSTGDEAKTLEDQWSGFDLLITDLVTPGSLQGDALIRLFWERCPQTPVLMLTGNAQIMNSAHPGNNSLTKILTKPVRSSEILKAISSLVPKL